MKLSTLNFPIRLAPGFGVLVLLAASVCCLGWNAMTSIKGRAAIVEMHEHGRLLGEIISLVRQNGDGARRYRVAR